MNLKNKLFAGLTALSLFASVLSPVASVSVKADSAEDMAAYTWAFDEGLTTMTSFDAFMFENAINREQAARFLVKGAEALGIELSSDQTCDYKDLASADQSLVEFINEGCELGLFKAQADFNPKQLMTREQAELVVARMVYGMDEVNAYAEDAGITEFAAARELLMADEIVKVEIPAQASVKRGHLLLMLYRLADADVVEPTAPGYAEVSLVSAPATQSVPYNANGVKVGTIKLTAGQNATTVSSVTVTRSGLGNVGDLQGAWLANANTVTDVKSFSSSSQTATIKFAPSLKLAAGESVNFDVMVALDANATVNSQHKFAVTSVNVSNGTASGSPVNLSEINTTSYKVANVTLAFDGTNTLQSGKTNEKITTVKVTPAKEATLKKVVINADSSEDLPKVFANVKAYYKGNVVGTVSVSDDKIVVEGLDIAALANETINLELKGDTIYVGNSLTVNLNAGSTPSTSVTAIEKASNYGMPVSSTGGAAITIQGIDLKITKTTTGAITVNPGASNVTLFEGEITSASDFDATKFWLKDVQGTFTGYTGLSDNKIILYVGGDDYELTTTGGNPSYSATSGFYFSSNSTKFSVEAGQKVKIKVVGSILSNANTGDLKFSFGIDQIKNIDNNTTMATSASRVGDTVKIRQGAATVKTATVAAPVTRTLYSNAEQEIGRFAVKATDDQLTLKEVKFALSGATINGAGQDLEELLNDVKLVNVADGSEISASLTLSGNEIKFDGISKLLAKDADVNLKLIADTNTFETSVVSGSVQLKLTAIKATRSSDGNDAAFSNLDAVKFVSYKIGVQPPVVTLTKIAANKFKVTFKNVDTENDYSLSGFDARVQTKADNNSNYTGTICLDIDGSSASSCTTTSAISSVTGSVGPVVSFLLNGADAVTNLTKDGGEISYTILVDSTFIEPDLLRASVLKVSYNGTSETYSVTAQ